MARVEDYSFGRVVVDGQAEERDLIVLPGRLVRNWWRKHGHQLELADLDQVLDELPERLLVGTGAYGRMEPGARLAADLRERGVAFEALPTADAVRRYAELDPERTALALHLTC